MDSTSSKENDQNDVTTLYVGNLSLKTTDSDIYRLFTTIGILTSVKLIRPSNDQFYFKPTCYAYVSYRRKEDAEEAIRRLNFHEMHGIQMRVMICDKNVFKDDAGNVVVKNLPDDVDDKTLYDTFSLFGKIISSKVASKDGKSLGYGYVQYEDKKSAKKAIKLGTGTKMNQHVLKVEKYEKKSAHTGDLFTNVYIKNFPADIDDQQLREVLERYGEVVSFCFPRKENGKPKGFAFCNYKDVEGAKRAIDDLHDKHVFNTPETFYIQRAQQKGEREVELRSSLAKLSSEGKSFKRNLYVTNIPENLGEAEIRDVFAEYGHIISVSVESDVRSKQGTNFAYVCFSTPEEASAALDNSQGISIGGNKLFVSLFKSKRERELERENTNFIYQPGFGFHHKMNNMAERKADATQDTRTYDDLYKLVYSLAPKYQDAWDTMNVSNRSEFADKVTHILLKKSRTEIQSMMEQSSALLENVSGAVAQYGEDDSKQSFKKK